MRISQLKIWLLIIILFAVIQASLCFRVVNPYWGQIIQYAGIVTISALGLNIIYGYTGQFSLGHAAFYGIGAYTSALITKCLGSNSPFVFLLSLLVGAAAAALIAFLVGRPILRLRSDYLGIATLGFGIIVKVIFDNADAVIPVCGGSRGMTCIPKFTSFAWVFFFFVASLIVVRNFVYSGYGRACISVREDEIAAEAMGINTTKYKTIGFVLGCAYAGIAGGLYAHLYCFLHPSNFDFLKSIDVLLIVVLGGLGSISGTLVASIVWTFLLEGLRVVLPPEILDWRLVIYPLLLVAMMLLRPKGLFGGKEVGLIKSGEEQ
ncbi:MAG: branched-chain amino acid ABC transporter permease [Candidatus Edwardsbacteria bacterium]